MHRNDNDALNAHDDYLNSAGDDSVLDYETQARMEAEDERREMIWAVANAESFLRFLQDADTIQDMLEGGYITPECFVEITLSYLDCDHRGTQHGERRFYKELTDNIRDYVENNLRTEYIDWAIENEEYL